MLDHPEMIDDRRSDLAALDGRAIARGRLGQQAVQLLALHGETGWPIRLARRTDRICDLADFVRALAGIALRIGGQRGETCALHRLCGFDASVLERRERGG